MSTLSYILLFNGLVSIFVASWIYFDARARAHPQYLYLSWGAFIFGLIGFWLPYLSIYISFRPVGKLVQCEKGHWKLFTLKSCPFCKVPEFPEEESLEDLPEKLKEVEVSLKELKPKKDWDLINLAEKRLSHYQNAYLTLFLYGLGLNLIFLLILLLLLFLKSAPLLFLVVFAFITFALAYLSLSLFKVISLVEGKIVYYKTLLNALDASEIEPLYFKDRGFYSRSSWSIQLVSGVFTSLILLALLFLQFSWFRLGFFEDASGIVLGILGIGVFLGLYLLIAGEIKSEIDVEKGREIFNLLALFSSSNKEKVSKAKTKAKVSRRKEGR
jgi:hypothetical protein